MNIMRHAARIFADEGLTNLVRRACSKLTRPSRREESIAVHQPLPFVVNDEIERAKSTFSGSARRISSSNKKRRLGWDGAFLLVSRGRCWQWACDSR